MTDIANYENNFTLIELGTTKLANNPAYKMVWTNSDVENGVKTGELKKMQVFTIIGENAYVIRYTSDLSKY